MAGERRLPLVVGGFVIASLALLGLVVLSFTQESGFLRPRYRLVTYFHNVQGLTSGAPVRLVGKDVGLVEFVTFAPLEGDLPPVRVVMQIDDAVRDRVRSDSVASIGTIGLLGDKYVELAMGTPEGRVLEEGEQLPSVSPLDLNEVVVRGTEAIDHVATLATNVNRVVEEFGRRMGGAHVAEAMEAVTEIAREVRHGDGLLHSLIYDRYEGGGVGSIERSLATLESILDEVARGDGVLHTLIYEPIGEQDVVAEAIRAGATLNSILRKVDGGEGTVGLLVNDPTLYEDLKLLVGGAQRSVVVRSLIRLSNGEPD
jgi:phospholipid/cholesterol/gamma-HCH transport system substrate-binding protein